MLLIVGGGPSALFAAARHSSETEVLVVGPSGPTGTLGGWVDSIRGTWLDTVPFDPFRKRWPAVTCADDQGRRGPLHNRPYGLFDYPRIREWVLSLPAVGWKNKKVMDIGERTVRCEDGEVLAFARVLDASGHRGAFGGGPTNPRYQSFYGEMLDSPGHGFDPEVAEVMNWESFAANDGGPPSFAYVLPLDDRTIFVEETVLVHPEAVSTVLLKARLARRKAAWLPSTTAVVYSERAALPMGGGYPRVAAFPRTGGAAAHVHPATGYMLSYTLRNGDRSPTLGDRVLRRVNNAGAAYISGLDSNRASAEFFTAFFSSPYWYEFMTREISWDQYVLTMLVVAARYARRADLMLSVVGELLRPSYGAPGLSWVVRFISAAVSLSSTSRAP